MANFFVCLIVYFLSSDKALERVSQFPVYLDSPDSDPEELNEFNTLLTEFFSYVVYPTFGHRMQYCAKHPALDEDWVTTLFRFFLIAQIWFFG